MADETPPERPFWFGKSTPERKPSFYLPNETEGWTYPKYGGFVSAAEYDRVRKKEEYLSTFLGKDYGKELPKLEPYYSRCVEEFNKTRYQPPNAEMIKAIKKRNAIMAAKNAKKGQAKKRTKAAPAAAKKSSNETISKKNNNIFARTKQAAKKTGKKKAAPGKGQPAKKQQKKPQVLPQGSPNIDELNTMERQLYSPPINYPTTSAISVGKKIGSAVIVESPEPKMCEHCKLKPCIVDAHFDELCKINSESTVLLCDPAAITYRKLEAFFRRLIVKYFGANRMKEMGKIPRCADDQCHAMAERDWSELECLL